MTRPLLAQGSQLGRARIHAHSPLVTEELRRALAVSQPVVGLVAHSDKGS